mmetsp:Transcript_65464/g.102214  ORF Transcript_65464/g.102214 Transcript_65464/m.102214 type:complete len:220 (+) Transcript_65464:34-693(+)
MDRSVSASSLGVVSGSGTKRAVQDPQGPLLELLQVFGVPNRGGYYDSKIRGKIIRFDNSGKSQIAAAGADATSRKAVHKRRSEGRHKEAQSKEHWKNLRYDDFHPLRELWATYIADMLAAGDSDAASVLASADLHGCTIEVVSSKSPGCVRVRGTIIEETQKIFRVISDDNRVRMLPKESCVFVVHLGSERFRLLGSAWVHRVPGGAPGPITPQRWALV